MSDSLQSHELLHTRPPCPWPTPRTYSNSWQLSQWCHPTISSSVVPVSSFLQSFPASGSFYVSQFFASGGQSIGVSASTSVLPMNIQDWSPLGWTGWISLQSKGFSTVFSNTTVHIDPMIQYVLILCIKYITNENLLYSTGNSTQSSVVTWMVRKSKNEWIYVYIWLTHFTVEQKLTQRCKTTILQ